ncbi:hypothetical protein FXB41_25675 [Bradyrhizobium canariense]|uniref:hypothetical protein n=1 Tax=Bradyrhizobium canariense TaxID=255045 RepID=UPI001CA5A456|nr:hypothetical protein [Bradyrhizobium canariense]MBW5438023.1 hypothetical protein [Bradyrhizobium canariense]
MIETRIPQCDRASWAPLVLWSGALLAPLLVFDIGYCQSRGARPVGGSDPFSAGLASDRAGSAGTENVAEGACITQHPHLLKAYRRRPPWRVAGVDYCVGHDTNAILKDPATISMEGTAVDATKQLVTVTGNNIALDSYDFSLNGGWQVRALAANAKIVNSNFVVDSNDLLPIVGTAEASNLRISHCTIDGRGHDPGPWGTLVAYSGSGLTVEYSWLKNSGGDMIQQIGGTGLIVIEHNLIENGGLSPGSHGDYTQLEGGPFTVAINYNTTVQNRGSTQGLMTEYVAEGEIGHNTMMGTVSYFLSVDLSSIETTFAVHDNYFDPRGYGFAYPSRRTGTPNDSSPKSIFTNNVNMRTGAIVQDVVRR